MFERKIEQPKKTENHNNVIVEAATIKSILSHCRYDTFIVVDLDNTIIEPLQLLGSDQWFEKFMEHALSLSNSKETISFVVAVYESVQHHAQMQLVEQEVAKLIKVLQDINMPIVALTARGENIANPTIRELKKNNIHFDDQWGNFDFRMQSKHNAGSFIFKDGIIFCSGKDKGHCLESFFDAIKIKPRHVLVVDDKEKNLHAVKRTIESIKVGFTGIRYGFLDDKIKKVDMSLAEKQLDAILHTFPENLKLGLHGMRVKKTVHATRDHKEQAHEAPAQGSALVDHRHQQHRLGMFSSQEEPFARHTHSDLSERVRLGH